MHETTGQRALRGLYSLAIRLALPFSLYYLIWRGLRQAQYFQRWSERFALYRTPALPGCLWVHAVSVGEVNAAAPLVEALRERHPESALLVTTTRPPDRTVARCGARGEQGTCSTTCRVQWQIPPHFQPRLRW